VYRRLFKGVPPKHPLSVLEAIIIGISFNLDYLESISDTQVYKMYETLLKQDEFSEENLMADLSGKTRLIGRIDVARAIFSGK